MRVECGCYLFLAPPTPQYEDGDGEELEDATPHSLESLLGAPGYVGYEGQYDEEEEDPDLKDEAILKIDMEVHYTSCVVGICVYVSVLCLCQCVYLYVCCMCVYMLSVYVYVMFLFPSSCVCL